MIPDDKVLFTLTRHPGALPADLVRLGLASAAVERGLDIYALSLLAERVDIDWFPHGCVIDLQRLGKLAGGGNVDVRAAANLSRVKLQGTDGIRGRISAEECSKRRALELYLTEGVLTPGFFALNAEAFGSYLRDTGGLDDGGSVVIGEDGRDRLTGGRVVPAVIRGLNASGCRVLDAGIIPTPGVPIASRRWGCSAGVIITASHNPSNQNGIKLLHDTFKLMDDGPQGEFGLSRVIFALAQEDADWSGRDDSTDISDEASSLLEDVIRQNLSISDRPARPVSLAYDGANGAFSTMAPDILSSLPFPVTILNVDSRGSNINQDGGVGEIEGNVEFPGHVAPELFESYFPVVKAVFRSGRGTPSGIHLGIVNDGDGDRGYLLVYEASEDSVLVVPGDELAMLLLGKRHADGELPPGAFMVNSVESDIMAAGYARAKYGVSNETACVGDKWLLKPVREGRPFIVGCEESGHVTFGVEVRDEQGRQGMVYTGNGLLSTLSAIEYILAAELSPREIAEPFPPGHKEIRYVYFVDKERFLPGTEPFRAAGERALESLAERLSDRDMNVRLISFADAPEMLYVGVFEKEGGQVASLFARNSGTESKTGVAIRCRRDLTPDLQAVMNELHCMNSMVLKSKESREYRMEECLLQALEKRPCPVGRLRKKLEESGFGDIPAPDFDALIYAMRKQELISIRGGEVRLLEK